MTSYYDRKDVEIFDEYFYLVVVVLLLLSVALMALMENIF